MVKDLAVWGLKEVCFYHYLSIAILKRIFCWQFWKFEQTPFKETKKNNYLEEWRSRLQPLQR